MDSLLFNLRDDFKQSRYITPLDFHIPYFDIIAFDNKFVEISEASNNRPYATSSTTEIHTTPDNSNTQIHDPNELLSDTSESQFQYSEQSLQRRQPITQQLSHVQLEKLSLQPNENPSNDNIQDELQNPNPTHDTQSTALTVDSNALLVHLRRVEEQKIRLDTKQDPQL